MVIDHKENAGNGPAVPPTCIETTNDIFATFSTLQLYSTKYLLSSAPE